MGKFISVSHIMDLLTKAPVIHDMQYTYRATGGTETKLRENINTMCP